MNTIKAIAITPSPRQRHARSAAAGSPPTPKPPIPHPALIATLCALICILATGCGNLQQAALTKSYFAINPAPPSSAATRPAANRGILTVELLHVVPPYDSLPFVYKIGPTQFDFDHYNVFIAPPSSLLTGSLITWLNQSGPLHAVSNGSSLRSDLILEGELTALYIDSTSTPHKAVLTGRFFLLRQPPTQTRLLADFPFTESSPVAAQSPAAFAQAFSQAWRQVLVELNDQLEKQFP